MNVVHELQASGGRAQWDGYNSNGQKFSSGVYFLVAQMSAKVNVELVKLLLYNDMKQESPTDISSLKESADALMLEDASKQLDLSVVIIHYQTP